MIQRSLFKAIFVLALVMTPTAFVQSQAIAPWQTAAGGTMAFEVASIRQSELGKFTPPNFPISSDNAYENTGGLFVADFKLLTYIEFAYKLWLSPEQRRAIRVQLPKWVATDTWEIRARAPGNPSKDQMRLMMQSLLADRFKMAIHFESQEVPVLALTVIKPGKLGPKLRPHAEGPACDATSPSLGTDRIFPEGCDRYGAIQTPEHRILLGSRNTTMDLIATSLPELAHLGRTVVNQTGLDGRYDFTLEWEPEARATASPEAVAPSDGSGPNFLEALKSQLGLKLEPKKLSLLSLIVDHIERPSDN